MSESPGGVIHDIGYRHYSGTRESSGRIALSLYLTGLRHVFGLGRSTRSKILPAIMAALTLGPVVIIVGVMSVTGSTSLPLSYLSFTDQVQWLMSIFVASQAPVLFSRDLRHRSIVLYLARPLSPAAFALTRWASLATACLLFIAVPQLVLYGGALLAGADVSEQTGLLLRGVPAILLLSAFLAGLTGLISSVALRRGMAVVASILLLVFGTLVVVTIQLIAYEEDIARVGELAGLFSPWTLTLGIGEAMGADNEVMAPLTASGAGAYGVVGLILTGLCCWLLVLRFRKAGR